LRLNIIERLIINNPLRSFSQRKIRGSVGYSWYGKEGVMRRREFIKISLIKEGQCSKRSYVFLYSL